jgi:uncharacterized protein YndB with AHSA1/START domain
MAASCNPGVAPEEVAMTETTTVPDAIERSIDIDAPAERVWGLISEPGWYINEGEIRPHRIERVDDDLVVVHDEKHGAFPIRTVALDPPRYAAFRWEAGHGSPEGAPSGATTLIEFWLVERAGGVTLRVVESGFATFGDDEAARRVAFEENSEGWATELEAARRHLERAEAR